MLGLRLAKPLPWVEAPACPDLGAVLDLPGAGRPPPGPNLTTAVSAPTPDSCVAFRGAGSGRSAFQATRASSTACLSTLGSCPPVPRGPGATPRAEREPCSRRPARGRPGPRAGHPRLRLNPPSGVRTEGAEAGLDARKACIEERSVVGNYVSTTEVRLTTQTGPDRRPNATVGGGFRLRAHRPQRRAWRCSQAGNPCFRAPPGKPTDCPAGRARRPGQGWPRSRDPSGLSLAIPTTAGRSKRVARIWGQASQEGPIHRSGGPPGSRSRAHRRPRMSGAVA